MIVATWPPDICRELIAALQRNLARHQDQAA
jgi:hypothetical protein